MADEGQLTAVPFLPRQHAAAARLVPASGRSAALDRLSDLAARLLSATGAEVSTQVSLLTDVQHVPGGHGLPEHVVGGTSPRAGSLCSVTVAQGEPLVVPRAVGDPRVSGLPPVTSGRVGSYLGVPLESAGEAFGALCAMSAQERTWSDGDVTLLQELARAVVAELELEALTAERDADRVRWDLAVDAAGIGIVEWELSTGALRWDERVQAVLGFGSGVLGSTVREALARVHPADRPALDAELATALRTGSDLRMEYRVVWPDGQVRWVAASGRTLGDGARFVGTVQDVTEVRTARDQAARLLESMTTGFLAIDQTWRVTYLNAAGAKIVGWSADGLVGQDLWSAFPGLRDSEFGRQYTHVVETGDPAEFEAYYAHLDAWFEVRAEADAAGGLALYFLDVTARQDDRRLAREATERLELLTRVTAELVEAGLDIEAAVARLSQFVVPQLADWCVVSLLEDDRVRDVGAWHHDPDLRPVLDDYVTHRLRDRPDPGFVQQVRDSGRVVVRRQGVLQDVLPTLGEQAAQALVQLDPESLAVVPLVARGSLTGVLSLVRTRGRPPMTEQEVETTREIALRAALALDNARLYAEQRSLAEALQVSLLTTPPEPDHCQIVVRYEPAAEVASVGGDWFDSFLQQDGATVLVIGDVMGHDTAAAAAMGQVRGLLRGIAWHSGDAPAAVLRGLDAAMQGLLVTTTASAVVARLEQDEDEKDRGITRVRWSSAGHPPPMLIHPDGQVQPLVGLDSELLLGIDPDTERTDTVTTVDRGSTLLLYTDGLVERRGQDLDAGLALLRSTLRELAHLGLDELCDELLVRLQPEQREDDVALVAVRLHRQDRPRPAEAGPQRVPPGVDD